MAKDKKSKTKCEEQKCACQEQGCCAPELVEVADAAPTAEALIGKLKTLTADYENFRTRSEREKTRMYDLGKMNVIENLLPIADNFALATKNADPADSFVKGVLMIQSQLSHMFDDMGVKKIPTIGEKFDIKYHNAVSRVDDETKGDMTIVEEIQAGYTYKDNIVRHAMVVVAN
ncbi:MAG: nucleotide exchange factor GrpE [Defluviitaleaceae bacterium]|nr:nucleotide exchange factor GrpE [Defluviitaleaceae bacterium]